MSLNIEGPWPFQGEYRGSTGTWLGPCHTRAMIGHHQDGESGACHARKMIDQALALHLDP